MALSAGRELSATLLADEAGISRPTASEHLRRLVDGGLLAVRSEGRHRHFRLAGPRVADLLERLFDLSPPQPIRSLTASTRAAQLRTARTCFDHLAGRLGVGVMAAMLQQGQLEGGDGTFDPATTPTDRPAGPGNDIDYRLTQKGERFLDRLGVTLPEGRRPLIRYCVDWTETRHHLAGRLGRAVRDRFVTAGWVKARESYRAVRITPSGEQVLREEFGIELTG